MRSAIWNRSRFSAACGRCETITKVDGWAQFLSFANIFGAFSALRMYSRDEVSCNTCLALVSIVTVFRGSKE